MESRKLSALLSSLITQLTLLLSLLFSHSQPSLSLSLSLALHELASASASAAVLSRKRPRPDSPAAPRLRRNPDPYKATFLMSASTFEWLAASLDPLLDCRDPAGQPLRLSSHLRLSIALLRLSSGSDFPDLSRRFRVSESAARFCCKHLCRVLCTDFRFWVDLPPPHLLSSVSDDFRSSSGLPHCCGALRSATFGPIAAHIVADSSSRILSVTAGFPASRHVIARSALFQDVRDKKVLNSPPVEVNGVGVDQYFVGRCGHRLLPWLMVPFSAAEPSSSSLGSADDCFDEALAEMGLSAARTVASLGKWGVLSRLVGEDPKSGVAYVGACSILHNALLMREDYSALADESEARSLSSEFDGFGFDDDDELAKESSRASLVRRALAKKAKEFRDSKQNKSFLVLQSSDQ